MTPQLKKRSFCEFRENMFLHTLSEPEGMIPTKKSIEDNKEYQNGLVYKSVRSENESVTSSVSNSASVKTVN